MAAYSVVLGTWKVTVKACFLQTRLELIKITKDPDEGKIEARWRGVWHAKNTVEPQRKVYMVTERGGGGGGGEGSLQQHFSFAELLLRPFQHFM